MRDILTISNRNHEFTFLNSLINIHIIKADLHDAICGIRFALWRVRKLVLIHERVYMHNTRAHSIAYARVRIVCDMITW